MKTNMPIYRAKKIDSDEYVEGFLVKQLEICKYHKIERELFFIIDVRVMSTHLGNNSGYIDCQIEIDPSTLAIHFLDMIDSEGTKIFASLSKDFRGGDIMKSDLGVLFNTIFNQNGYSLRNGENIARYDNWNKERIFKVTGIQQ